MKTSVSRLPLYPRRRFGNPNVTARSDPARRTGADIGLRPEDGYDWLRRIKPIRAAQRAGQ
jgi:hypothetical protein